MNKKEEATIVVVDDEPSIRQLLMAALHFQGFEVISASTGSEAIEVIKRNKPDLVVLDVMLPDIDGFTVTRRLRKEGIESPVLFLTARDDTQDKIMGLTVGGDDYVTKPLELRELVVRVKNLLWRIDLARQAQPHTQDNCYRFAGYCLNVSRHTLERDGEPIKLTRAEYEMLVAFVTNPGEILSRERLLRMLSARRVENPDLRTVDVLIRRLRHKLSADLLVTQHGEGYFLAADVC